MRKIIFFLTAILCLSILAGCDDQNKDPIDNESGETTTSSEDQTIPEDTTSQNTDNIENESDTDTESSESQTVSEDEDNQSLVKYENGTYTITLPESNIVLEVDDYYEIYIPLIKDELIAEAEAKIAAAVADYPGHSGYHLISDYEGHLCLCIEIIRDIDPPNIVVEGDVTISSGCGIDHEHIFFAEIITE